jgi:hypothetical protein
MHVGLAAGHRELEENGAQVLIKKGLMHIWDRKQKLLAKVPASNQLYIMHINMAQPLCLSNRHNDVAWQ